MRARCSGRHGHAATSVCSPWPRDHGAHSTSAPCPSMEPGAVDATCAPRRDTRRGLRGRRRRPLRTRTTAERVRQPALDTTVRGQSVRLAVPTRELGQLDVATTAAPIIVEAATKGRHTIRRARRQRRPGAHHRHRVQPDRSRHARCHHPNDPTTPARGKASARRSAADHHDHRHSNGTHPARLPGERRPHHERAGIGASRPLSDGRAPTSHQPVVGPVSYPAAAGAIVGAVWLVRSCQAPCCRCCGVDRRF